MISSVKISENRHNNNLLKCPVSGEEILLLKFGIKYVKEDTVFTNV